MYHDQTERATLKNVIIVPWSAPRIAESRNFTCLRFIHSHKFRTHYEIVEKLPFDLWDQSNAIQPADPSDYLAISFRPVTGTAIGRVVLEDANSQHRIAISFRYDPYSWTTYKDPFLELSDTYLDWEDVERTLPTSAELHPSEGPTVKPVTATLEVQGVKMTATLLYIPSASDSRSLELCLEESDVDWYSKKVKQGRAKAAQLFGSLADTTRSGG